MIEICLSKIIFVAFMVFNYSGNEYVILFPVLFALIHCSIIYRGYGYLFVFYLYPIPPWVGYPVSIIVGTCLY